jgi:hypothetical protein
VTSRLHNILLAILAALALLGAGCGKDEEKGKPIPSAQASELQRQLDSINGRFDFGDGACNDIQKDNVPTVDQILNQIPPSVDRDVRNALRDSFERLFQLTASQCDEQKGQKTTPTQTETTPTQTETTPTETQPTETQTTPTQTQPEKPGKGPKKDKTPKGGGGTGEPKGNGGAGALPGGGQ